MSHYYTNQSDTKSKPKVIKAYFPFQDFDFVTDHGVFSRHTIDFGSRLLIMTAMAELPDGRMLDVGCGYGPIGIVLATLKPTQRMDMVDINDRALTLAKQNVQRHNLTNVEVFYSDMYENITEEYAMILTNPPVRAGKHTVHAMIEQAKEHLRLEGCLWVVLQVKQGANSAQDKMQDVFGNVEIKAKDKGYVILRSQKL